MSKISYDVAGYDEFRARARAEGLSGNQKAGFPDEFRAGRSAVILADIEAKLPAFAQPGARLLDIGTGCSDLSHEILRRAGERGQNLTLVDSAEVLSKLADVPGTEKVEGPFPACIDALRHAAPFDAILVYSVIQYVFVESSLHGFIDAALSLLDGTAGALLIGDIPNASMRKRFFGSAAGRTHHERFYTGQPSPSFRFNAPEPWQIDDAVVLGILARARAAGFQTFALPQGETLPMANRREDILIRRP
jgi:hypothetical protein